MNRIGTTVLRTETLPDWGQYSGPFFHHTPSAPAFNMLEDFLSGMLELRNKNNDRIPPPEEWPVQREYFGRTLSFLETNAEEFAKRLDGSFTQIVNRAPVKIISTRNESEAIRSRCKIKTETLRGGEHFGNNWFKALRRAMEL